MINDNVLTIKAIFKGKHNGKQFHPVWKGTWGYASFENFLEDWQVDRGHLTMLQLVF